MKLSIWESLKTWFVWSNLLDTSLPSKGRKNKIKSLRFPKKERLKRYRLLLKEKGKNTEYAQRGLAHKIFLKSGLYIATQIKQSKQSTIIKINYTLI